MDFYFLQTVDTDKKKPVKVEYIYLFLYRSAREYNIVVYYYNICVSILLQRGRMFVAAPAKAPGNNNNYWYSRFRNKVLSVSTRDGFKPLLK